MRDVAASHDTLIHLFERVHFFMQRLKSYTGMPLTNESTALLGKIMAQLLSILALSTKAMTDRRISKLIPITILSSLTSGIEKIFNKLVGRKDVEDALSRLDMLTKEESLMVVVRNLEVTYHVDGVVHDVDDNVKATKVLAEDIDGNVKVTKVLVEDNAKGIEKVTLGVDNGTQHFLSVFRLIPTLFPILSLHSHR